MRELADDLSVNYKTIRRVYLQLAQEGLLEIVAGSGAFLRKRNGGESFAHMRRQAIFRLLGTLRTKPATLDCLQSGWWQCLTAISPGAI